jgi:hypothetical protein
MSSVGGATGQFAGLAASSDAGTGAGVGKSVSAWRRVFEREQLAALAKFRSVAMGGGREAGAYGMQSGQPGAAVANAKDAYLAPSSAHPGQPGGGSAFGMQARPTLYGNFLSYIKPSMVAGEIWTGVWGGTTATRTPSPETVQAPLAPAASPQAALLSSGDWPWRKLHCMVDADGIHVWLRDATIDADDNALLEWIGQLHQALAQAGARLASFTLNGIAISPIA